MFQTLLDLQQISVGVVRVIHGRCQCVHTGLHREMEEVTTDLHRKKSFSILSSPAGTSLTKLSLGGNNFYMTSLFPPRVSDIPAGDGNLKKLSLRCTDRNLKSVRKALSDAN